MSAMASAGGRGAGGGGGDLVGPRGGGRAQRVPHGRVPVHEGGDTATLSRLVAAGSAKGARNVAGVAAAAAAAAAATAAAAAAVAAAEHTRLPREPGRVLQTRNESKQQTSWGAHRRKRPRRSPWPPSTRCRQWHCRPAQGDTRGRAGRQVIDKRSAASPMAGPLLRHALPLCSVPHPHKTLPAFPGGRLVPSPTSKAPGKSHRMHTAARVTGHARAHTCHVNIVPQPEPAPPPPLDLERSIPPKGFAACAHFERVLVDGELVRAQALDVDEVACRAGGWATGEGKTEGCTQCNRGAGAQRGGGRRMRRRPWHRLHLPWPRPRAQPAPPGPHSSPLDSHTRLWDHPHMPSNRAGCNHPVMQSVSRPLVGLRGAARRGRRATQRRAKLYRNVSPPPPPAASGTHPPVNTVFMGRLSADSKMSGVMVLRKLAPHTMPSFRPVALWMPCGGGGCGCGWWRQAEESGCIGLPLVVDLPEGPLEQRVALVARRLVQRRPGGGWRLIGFKYRGMQRSAAHLVANVEGLVVVLGDLQRRLSGQGNSREG